jgi:hypothetical protein
MSDVTFLLGEFDQVDCGVETEIEIECPECFSTTRVELPFEKGFFLPEKTKRTKPTEPTKPAVSTTSSLP